MSFAEQLRVLEVADYPIPFEKILKELEKGYTYTWLNAQAGAWREKRIVITRAEDFYFRIELANSSILAEAIPAISLSITRRTKDQVFNKDVIFWVQGLADKETQEIYREQHFSPGGSSLSEDGFWREFETSVFDFQATHENFQVDRLNAAQAPFNPVVSWHLDPYTLADHKE